MPDCLFRFYRTFFIGAFLILLIAVASPPAFSGFFPLERIHCGTKMVKVKMLKDLEGNPFQVALGTKGKTVVIARASAGNSETGLSILAQLCDGMVKTLDPQWVTADYALASNGIEIFTVGDQPIDVTGGDFNGDGHLDIAVANFASDTLSIILSENGTRFAPPIHVPTGSEPRAIVSGDFDTDGKIDLATANLGDGIGNISLLMGTGHGGFAAPISVAVSSSSASFSPTSFSAAALGSSPASLAAGDFNKDGKLDLAIADSAGTVLVKLGNGNGTFQPPTALNAPGQFSIIAEDINGDEAVDLVTNGVVLLNDGTGNFPTATGFAIDFQSNIVRAGDLDGDGILDLVTANATSNSVSVFLGRGDGSFQAPLHYIVGNSPGEIIIEDLNSNGIMDLAVSNFSSKHVSLLFGTGNGGFIGGQAFPSTSNANQATNHIALADFDGDGLLDLAAVNLFGNWDATVLKGQAFGKFAVPFSLTGQNGEGVVAGDFNGDAKPDLAFIQPGRFGLKNDAIEVRLGNGDLSFGSPSTLILPDADFALNFVLAVDVDNNGTLDLVTANTGTDNVSVFLGNGNGTFQSSITTSVGNYPVWMAAGHLDDNATLDLAVINAGLLGEQAGKLSILFGNGNGAFSLGPEFFINTEPNSVVISDFNGDSKSDLAAIVEAPRFKWNLQIVPGNGNGTFSEPILIPFAEDIKAKVGNLTVSDLNVDGKQDLIMTVGTEIGILVGEGDGTFQPLLLIDGGTPSGPVTVIDLNHDQRPDLVIPQSRGGTTAVLLNIAAAPTNISHDMNSDATADLVWRDTSTGVVALWLMNGPKIKSFGFPGGVALDWQIGAIGDVNADGNNDIIWRNTTSGLVAIWLMNGLTITSTGFPGKTPTAWRIAGAGDVNGNGTADIIWRNTITGEVALWLMNGATITSAGYPPGVSLEWEIAEVGDVNADGKADVIWRNSTSGVVAVWLMNGLTISSVGLPGSNPTSWVIAGTGDVNGNGTADIVWRNTGTGEVAIWLMEEGTMASAGFLSRVSLNWQIVQVGDVNADGRADIIWRNHTNGVVAVWMMNGLAIASVGFPGTAPTDWNVQ